MVGELDQANLAKQFVLWCQIKGGFFVYTMMNIPTEWQTTNWLSGWKTSSFLKGTLVTKPAILQQNFEPHFH